MRRVLLRVGVLAVVVLAGALVVLPDLRWWAWGRLRGEAFYRGRPTSYFREKLKRDGFDYEPVVDTRDWAVVANPPPLPLEGHPDVDAVYRRLGLSHWEPEVLIDSASADRAIPVLIELVRDDDADVVADAAYILGLIGPPARTSAPALITALNSHREDGVRLQVAWALWDVDRRPEIAVPALAALLKSKDTTCRRAAAMALIGIGTDAREAVPALVEALADEDAKVRFRAGGALTEIDPRAAAEAGVGDAP